MRTTLILYLFLFFFFSCSDSDDKPIHTVGWKKLISHTQNGLSDVEFINDDFGIICGDFGTLLKTENGGQFWQPLQVGVNSTFMKTFILNENEFYVSRVGLFKTNSGGVNFIEIGNFSSFGATIFEIHFFDSNNGLIYKSGQILKTVDGGENWNTVYDQAGFASIMQFVSDSIGYIAGGISYDGISYGELHKTINRGNSWSEIDIPLEVKNSEVLAIYFISEDFGYLANYKKEFYTTQDGGTTWNLTCDTLPNYISDMVFLTQNEGYGIVGYNSIYKTTDGGMTWIMEYTNSTMFFSSIAKTPNGKIFVVGNDGVILKRE